MLRRTPFKRKPAAHEPAVEKEPRPLAKATRRANYGGSVSGVAVSKEAPVRSEAYRRLVAAMPCADCRFPGRSQAAHANYGKGMAIKSDDRTCFPLCPRCHRLHDQGGGMPREMRRDYEAKWGAETRAAITAAGQWPKNLPRWEE